MNSSDVTAMEMVGVLLAGMLIGVVIGASAVAAPNYQAADEGPASVECTLFMANESPAGICVASGDVQVEWVESLGAESGTVKLWGLPSNNSTAEGSA